jgi:hypothetical protein
MTARKEGDILTPEDLRLYPARSQAAKAARQSS